MCLPASSSSSSFSFFVLFSHRTDAGRYAKESRDPFVEDHRSLPPYHRLLPVALRRRRDIKKKELVRQPAILHTLFLGSFVKEPNLYDEILELYEVHEIYEFCETYEIFEI